MVYRGGVKDASPTGESKDTRQSAYLMKTNLKEENPPKEPPKDQRESAAHQQVILQSLAL